MADGAKRGMFVGSNKGTIVSSTVRKNEALKRGLLSFIEKSDKPLSTSDLRFMTGKSWHTIDRACLMLQIEGRIEGFKVGKMNLWRVK